MGILKQALPTIASGLIIGVIAVIISVAFATLIFGSILPSFIIPGAGMMLVTAIIVGVIVSLGSSIPTAIGIPEGRIVPLFAIMASAIVAAMQTFSPDEKFATVAIAIHITTSITGIAFLVLGRFKLSGVMQYIPTPVMGGFLAGCGWLLLTHSIPIITGLPAGNWNFSLLFDESHLLRWVPTLVMGIALVFVIRRWRNPILLPAGIIGLAALFYLVLYVKGISVADAMQGEWLIRSTEGKSLLGWPLASLSDASWQAIYHQAGHIFTIVTISVVSLLFGATVLEMDKGQDINLNRELRSAGYANIVSAFAGGIIGFHSLNLTGLNVHLGVRNRMAAIVAAGVALLFLLAGTFVVAFIPFPVLGCALLYFALTILIEWLYDGWFKLPLFDYLVLLLILGTIIFFGYIVGVLIGMIMALILFAIQYSRTNVIRQWLTGANSRSNVDRTAVAEGILADEGRKIAVVKLQGYLYFGSANDVLEAVKGYVAEHPERATRYLILDFASVDGIDSSAVASFIKISRFTVQNHLRLIFAGIHPPIVRQLKNENFHFGTNGSPDLFDDLDHSLEWCENDILTLASITEDHTGNIRDQLTAFFHGALDVNDLIPYLQRRELRQGECLINEGADSDDMFFLESGTLSVELRLEKDRSIRVRRLRPGSIVGEVAYYNKGFRTASVTACEPCVVYQLTHQAIADMKRQNSILAAHFHEHMASLLADRLFIANNALRSAVN